jgi:pyruvate/2-oxoglutarate dehydrogenase complex dihydrolipoamide acyltransferase (E2) component
MPEGLIELQMPQMGESVTEGTILEWHVSEGQEVAEGDTVVEVSTDKIDAEVPAPASGVVTKILAQPDDTVEVGQVLAQIDPNGSGNGASPLKESDGLVMGGGEGDEDLGDDSVEAESATPGELETPAPSADPDAPGREAEEAGGTLVIPMPEMGESVTEGTVLEWHVEEGQQVAEGDTVIEVSTDKIDAEVPAPAAGTITKLLVNPDDTVQVGQALAEMTTGAGAAVPAADPAAPGREAEEAGGTSVVPAGNG